jgi:hypothetical protein
MCAHPSASEGDLKGIHPRRPASSTREARKPIACDSMRSLPTAANSSTAAIRQATDAYDIVDCV